MRGGAGRGGAREGGARGAARGGPRVSQGAALPHSEHTHAVGGADSCTLRERTSARTHVRILLVMINKCRS